MAITQTTSNNAGPRVICLGMSRTGTASMKAALQILGYHNVYHAYELYTNPTHAAHWEAAWDAKVCPCSRHPPFTKADWDQLLGPYAAVTDMPAVCFVEELTTFYPDAKVVLVEREEDAWFKSFDEGVISTFWHLHESRAKTLMLLDPQLFRPLHRLWSRLFARRDGYFRATTRAEMRANARLVYREHNIRVRECTRPESLLEYNLGQGWGPLCRFLGTALPKEEFPYVNEGDAVKNVVAKFAAMSKANAI